QAVGLAAAPIACAEILRHGGERPVYLALLPGDIPRELLGGASALLADERDDGIGAAVGERLPSAHLYALAYVVGNEPRHRTRAVEVLDDHPRIENRGAVVG